MESFAWLNQHFVDLLKMYNKFIYLSIFIVFI